MDHMVRYPGDAKTFPHDDPNIRRDWYAYACSRGDRDTITLIEV